MEKTPDAREEKQSNVSLQENSQGKPELVIQNGKCVVKKLSERIELTEAQIILDSIFQPKNHPDPEQYEHLKQSIRDKGQREYVHVFLGSDGHFHLYDGHQRFNIVFKDLKLPTIKAVIDDVTFEEALRLCVDLNRNTTLSVQDEAEYYGRLLTEESARFPNQKAIITAFNVPQSRLSQILTHQKTLQKIESHLSDDEKQKVKDVPEYVARPIKKIPQAEVQAAVMVASTENNLTFKDTSKITSVILEKKVSTKEEAEKEITILLSARDDERASLRETSVTLNETIADKALDAVYTVEEKPSKTDVKRFFEIFTEKLLIMIPKETVEAALELAIAKYQGDA